MSRPAFLPPSGPSWADLRARERELKRKYSAAGGDEIGPIHAELQALYEQLARMPRPKPILPAAPFKPPRRRRGRPIHDGRAAAAGDT